MTSGWVIDKDMGDCTDQLSIDLPLVVVLQISLKLVVWSSSQIKS